MNTQREDDLEAVLRTLALAQAQLRALAHDFVQDPAQESEIRNLEVAIGLLQKKVNKLRSKDP